MSSLYTTALGLDLGKRKIGVARVNAVARIPEPLATIENNDLLIERLRALIHEHAADLLVVGLPRNMSGQETEQTTYTKDLADRLATELSMPYVFQDETLSTSRALEYQRRTRSAVSEDAIAACIILEDFVESADASSDKIEVNV